MKNFLFSLATLMDGETTWSWVTRLTDFLETVLPYVLIVVATAGTIYAVVLGVKMARAEDASARDEAKKRIINFVVALAVTILLILLLRLFVQYLPTWLGYAKNEAGEWYKPSSTSGFIGLLK